MEESITRERNENKCKQDKGFLYKKKFCTNANAKVSVLCMWQRSGKELCAVYKMSTLGAQEVFWSSWKFNPRKRFYLQKMLPGVVFEDEDNMISLDGDSIEVVDRFSYLGDVISTEEGAQEAVTSRIRSVWKKFKEISNLICGRSMSLKVRGTLYKSYVRNALTYGAECWALKMEDERRLKTTEMRLLRMICGKTLKDKMNNEKIREMTGVVRLEEFLREKRLRWLGHVEKMDEERGPVKALLLEVDGTKKGRLKKRWKEVLECDMTARGLQRLDAQDRERW